MIELLAPAGSKEALIAAVEGGADGVYLSGKMFGARAYAANFDEKELEEAVRFAHLRNVNVYVTVNTLVDDSEISSLVGYLRYLYEVGVDAIIVQDLGVAKLAKQIVPQLPLHASTQMTVHNLAGVEFLAQLGFERVVLARELSLEEIRFICSKSPVEIEVFGHGALCISYSGQCLMSSMIGGRSGNRGRCAQPCRLPYTLVDSEGNPVMDKEIAGDFLLSPRDLNTLKLLPELIDAGVKSFKIEGRMKRPEYVAVVVDTYRRAMDAYFSNNDTYVIEIQDQKNITQIFNRDFTTAYLEGKKGREMMSDRRPNNRGVRVGRVVDYQIKNKIATIKLDEPLFIGDIIDFWVKVGGRVSTPVHFMTVGGCSVSRAEAGKEVCINVNTPVRVNDRVFKVFDAELMERARSFFKEATPKRRIPVKVEVQVAEGTPLFINIIDKDGFAGFAKTTFIAEKALKRPVTEEIIRKQMDRLGATVFYLEEFVCNIDGEIMVPVSEMNDARRRAVEDLEKARLAKFQRKPLHTSSVDITFPSKTKLDKKKTLLSVSVDTLEKVQVSVQKGADVILFGGESFKHKAISFNMYEEALAVVRSKGKQIIFNTSRITKEWQIKHLKEELILFQKLKPDAIAVGNLGILKVVKDHVDLPIHGEAALNVYNSVALAFLKDVGLVSQTLSPELTFRQIEEIVNKAPILTECLVHGHIPLMVSEYCVLGSFIGGLHTGVCSRPCERGQYWLKDRKDEIFPIVTDQFCRMHILNAKELSMLPHVGRFSEIGVGRIRIEGKNMETRELSEMTQLYREILDLGDKHPMHIADTLTKREHEHITRGHYFRGVL